MEPRSAAELVFSYGPWAFIGLSFVLSVPLARALGRRFGRPRRPDEAFWERPDVGARALALLGALALIWGASTALGRGLLAVPDPRGRATHLRIDAAVLAHAVPPLSGLAAERLAASFRAPDEITRFQPAGELERRFVDAARIDPDAKRAVTELSTHGFRTRAGRFALASTSTSTCDVGLDALAESLQGSALQELMLRCRNAPGDAIGRAAFKLGDFSRAVGPEAESIISRQPRSPTSEPRCFAGGYELPEASLPICRLIHGEMVPKTRADVLATPITSPSFAARWYAAAKARPGEPLARDVTYTIDPMRLVQRPRDALRDEPIAVYRDLLERSGVSEGGAWIRLAVAASASQGLSQDRAREGVVAALADLERQPVEPGASDDPRPLRLALAIAIRAGASDLVDRLASRLPADDPLVRRARWLTGAVATPTDPRWVQLAAAGAPGAAIADALAASSDVPEDLGRLARVAPAERGALVEWLREGFPTCDGCDFAATLDHVTLRLDAARALDDAPLSAALGDVYRRYEAVLHHRVLALSLRAAAAP